MRNPLQENITLTTEVENGTKNSVCDTQKGTLKNIVSETDFSCKRIINVNVENILSKTKT